MATGRRAAYAKDVVMADFESPGDDDMVGKVKADLAKASQDVSDRILRKHLAELEAVARQQVMKE
jgi:hypothetical protein